MARLLQALRRILGPTPSAAPKTPSPSPSLPSQPIARRFPYIDTNFTYLREGDRAVVDGKTPLLTKPLRKGGRTDVRRGKLEHDDIIGRRVRDLIPSHKGPEYRLYLPTLEEYVALTPRLVTPIYSADANLIVSLLDIHVAPSSDPEQAPLEILESGTGHGSLTLHLARAIQGANSIPPPFPTTSQVKDLVPSRTSSQTPSSEPTTTTEASPEPATSSTSASVTTTTTTSETNPTDSLATQTIWDNWRSQRKAVIHTVDITHKTARHAETLVRGFRRGIYAGNVDFYSGPVETWVAAQKQERSRSAASTAEADNQTTTTASEPEVEVDPFLSYAILDMPSSHLRIPHVTSILKRDGLLAVFTPSVTQIGDCLELIRRERLPLIQEKVVELGNGISSGRLWDVRHATRKTKETLSDAGAGASFSSSVPEEGVEAEQEGAVGEEVAEGTAASASASSSVDEGADRVLVCRPKVGTRIVGGGFIGIWRRIEDWKVKEKVATSTDA